MEPDRLPPRLRRIVDAAETVDERLLVLLFVRKAESAVDLAELLAVERSETMTALGRLSQERLVAHHRPEGEAIQWFATAEGKVRGERAVREIAGRIVASAAEPEAPPAEEPAPEAPAHDRLKTRRRVSIDQSERGGFSWD